MPFRLLAVLLLLLTAGGLGYIALLAVRPGSPVLEAEAAPAPPPPVRLRYLAAARPLQVGTLLKDEDFTVREFPTDAVPEGALLASDEMKAELRGAMLRRWLEPNATLARADVLHPRDRGFLAAVLRPGTRAMAVGVDAVTGAAGLIWPGDQVDVLLTQELEGGGVTAARRYVGETVLNDARVIAVDQQFTQGAGPSDAGPRNVARTVTLEVSAEQAERLAVAQRLGRLSLTVRAIEPSSERPPLLSAAPVPTFGGDVSRALLPGEGARMRLIQGGDQTEVSFR
ncbi:Flp pilus assembly protein CpaB [Sabulicella glaciei]|uniref:Flp pilus assembly protein CpaB n=1 Tax=Sabulicella glaciei TaxID=2984948 RepID=A0ABT3NQ98_9PROT|nr:Flp pilus assembly protein CpaB [Roseococcus sp. MDT2-1-1]MCW8084322.1 Flp pilus assembly protein CpaB [Roseococcus sp. MDT2-1-1]